MTAVPGEPDVPAACGGVAAERGDAGELGLPLRPDRLDVKRLRGLPGPGQAAGVRVLAPAPERPLSLVIPAAARQAQLPRRAAPHPHLIVMAAPARREARRPPSPAQPARSSSPTAGARARTQGI
jgi:hypothetical protein